MGLEYAYLSEPPKEEKPLLILLHGYGADEYNLLSLAEYFPNYSVISLKAPFNLPTGGNAWCDIYYQDSLKTYNLDQLEESRQKILDCIESITLQYNISTINLLGFSQGSVVTYSLALSKPELFKSVITLSGFIYEEFVNPILADLSKIQKLNIFIGHGRLDNVVDINKGRNSLKYLNERGINCSYKEYDIQHLISENEIGDIMNWLKNI